MMKAKDAISFGIFGTKGISLIFSLRLLKLAMALASLVPLSAGLAGIFLGPSMVDQANGTSVSLDSHFRYLSGLLFGLGLGFLSLIPKIETNTSPFRLLSLIVVTGGLGRLTSLVKMGTPDASMVFGLIMELVVVPLLVFWQSKLSRVS